MRTKSQRITRGDGDVYPIYVQFYDGWNVYGSKLRREIVPLSPFFATRRTKKNNAGAFLALFSQATSKKRKII